MPVEAQEASLRGAACPFSGAKDSGCPVSPKADAFDVFEGDYQVDPAEALRWSREEQPVFYSPRLGYWVVTRYDLVKSVFRDSRTFSPANALEKITPTIPEASAILARYKYAMNRTLVNEDEPAHTERRRALMQSFLPGDLAHHEPMVRRLTRAYVDRFVDHGRADLVNEMLWEIPLTVALHFLGVPEDDMAKLREYSIAHTVNTWGRPTPAQQSAVAEAVGRFWQFAGEVLERMRAEPDGNGWMHYAIRQQAVMPDVVTDSYLHSMMMAGIVAAHETTAHASANALRLLLDQRATWAQLCADPSLIPNAVEECLRLAGSIIAWRRVALCDTEVGGVAMPRGTKLLIVMTSANHDGRHFENPDDLDIFRDNATDHLSFGYGSHQCMGKDLARMEMRIFLEEFTRRLPHMELVADQHWEYLPNVSFRGPDHLLVQWDPAKNPERADPALRSSDLSFPIGAPARESIRRTVRVAAAQPVADGILKLTLVDPEGRDLPAWTPGAHIDLVIGGFVRKYSLCGNPDDRRCLEVAIRREDGGRGGSAHIHKHVAAGTLLPIRGPKNQFRLDEAALRVVLVAGGIGITPIIAMADRLKALGRDYAVHFAGRGRQTMAFLDRLGRDHAARLHLYPADAGMRLDLTMLVAQTPVDVPIYACGPSRLLTELADLATGRNGQLHFEHFASATRIGAPDDVAFEARLEQSGRSLVVGATETLLEALRREGVDVPSDCGEGLCGTCEVAVLHGEVDHRDTVLSTAERRANARMMTCCSRARGASVSLAL